MTITAEEAAAQFMALLDRVAEGEQITITQNGIPVARLIRIEAEYENQV